MTAEISLFRYVPYMSMNDGESVFYKDPPHSLCKMLPLISACV